MQIDPGMLPFVDGCLLLQAAFYNFLWAMLFWGWYTRAEKYPNELGAHTEPGQIRVAFATGIGTMVLAASVATFQPAHWILGLALAMGTFLSVLDGALALCFTLSMLLMRPWEVMEANPVILLLPKFSTIFSFLWAGYYYVWIDKFGIRVNRVVVLLGAYSLWLAFSTFITPDPGTSFGKLMEVVFPYLIVVYLIFQLARSRFAVWAVKLSLMTVFTSAGFISIYFYFSGYQLTGRIRAFGSFANTNDIAAVMAILLPLAIWAYKDAKSLTGRLMGGFSSGVALMVLALAQSRGAVVACAAAVAAYAYRRVQSKSLALLVIAMIFLAGNLSTMLFTRDEGDIKGSTSSRSVFWISGLRMGLLNPVFGVGFNEFFGNVEAYALEAADEKGQHTAHSAWILAFAESGFLGLIFFVSFFFYGWLHPAARMYNKDPSWFYAGIMYTVSISFLSHTYFIFPYLLTAIVMVSYLAEMGATESGEARSLTTRAGLPASTLPGG